MSPNQEILNVAAAISKQIFSTLDEMNLSSVTTVRYRSEIEDGDNTTLEAVYISVCAKYPPHEIWCCEVNQWSGSSVVDWLVEDCTRVLEIFDRWINFEPDEIYQSAIALYPVDDLYNVVLSILLEIGLGNSEDMRSAARAMLRMISDLDRNEQIRRIEHLAYMYDIKLIY